MHRASGLRSQYHVLLLAPLAILIVLALIFGRSLLGSPAAGSTTFSSEPLASGAARATPASTAPSTRKHAVPAAAAGTVPVASGATPLAAPVKDLGVAKGVLRLKGPARAAKGDVVVFVLNGARHLVRTDSSMPFATSLNVASLPNGKYTVAVLWMHRGAATSVASTSTVTIKNAKPAAGTSTGVAGKGGADSGDGVLNAKYIAAVVSITNDERKKAGCDPLTVSSELTAAAQDHTSDMAKKKYFSHDGKDGSSPFDRMKAAGYSFAAAGENIAMGQQTPHVVMDAWMNSSGHRANILNCTYTQIGIGYAVDNTGAPYWTQDFGKPL